MGKVKRFLGLGDGVQGIFDAWIGLIMMAMWFSGFSTSTRSYNSSESPSWQSAENSMKSHGRTRVVSIIWYSVFFCVFFGLSETSVKNDQVKKTVQQDMLANDIAEWKNQTDASGNKPNASKPDTDFPNYSLIKTMNGAVASALVSSPSSQANSVKHSGFKSSSSMSEKGSMGDNSAGLFTVGSMANVVFGFIDNSGLFAGLDASDDWFQEKFKPGAALGAIADATDERQKAGLGNTFSDMLGAFMGEFFGLILGDVIDPTGKINAPFWLGAMGIFIGCLLGISIPRLIQTLDPEEEMWGTVKNLTTDSLQANQAAQMCAHPCLQETTNLDSCVYKMKYKQCWAMADDRETVHKANKNKEERSRNNMAQSYARIIGAMLDMDNSKSIGCKELARYLEQELHYNPKDQELDCEDEKGHDRITQILWQMSEPKYACVGDEEAKKVSKKEPWKGGSTVEVQLNDEDHKNLENKEVRVCRFVNWMMQYLPLFIAKNMEDNYDKQVEEDIDLEKMENVDKVVFEEDEKKDSKCKDVTFGLAKDEEDCKGSEDGDEEVSLPKRGAKGGGMEAKIMGWSNSSMMKSVPSTDKSGSPAKSHREDQEQQVKALEDKKAGIVDKDDPVAVMARNAEQTAKMFSICLKQFGSSAKGGFKADCHSLVFDEKKPKQEEPKEPEDTPVPSKSGSK